MADSHEENGLVKPKVETRIKYYGEMGFRIGYITYKGHLFRRRDYHEDGTQSEYCGVELNKDRFEDLRDAMDRRDPGIIP